MIDIKIHIIDETEDETIDIFCHEDHKERMQELAREFTEGRHKITCKKEDKTYQIRLEDIFYIETVDEHLFIYCEDEVYENRMRLYEAEQLCKDTLFFKASKSMLIIIVIAFGNHLIEFLYDVWTAAQINRKIRELKD